MSTKVNIALLGFGTVGQGFAEVLSQLGSDRFAIHGVAVRDTGKLRNGDYSFTTNVEALIADPKVDVVVEATGNTDSILQWYHLANALNKPFVTANKAFVSRYPQLRENLFYDAACGGAMPAIRFSDAVFYQGVQSVRGILNGSTNFILSSVFLDGLRFADALQLAKDRGFVEPDERLDLNGQDPAAKLSILVRHLFKAEVKPSQVAVIPLLAFGEDDVRFIKRRKLGLRYIATAVKNEERLALRVVPELLPLDDVFLDVRGEENALSITDAVGESYFLKARGAGRTPTGVALFNDVQAAVDGDVYKPSHRQRSTDASGDVEAVVRSSGGIATQLSSGQILGRWSENGQVFEHLICRLDELVALSNLNNDVQPYLVSDALRGARFLPSSWHLEEV